jgi:hypothetical protein
MFTLVVDEPPNGDGWGKNSSDALFDEGDSLLLRLLWRSAGCSGTSQRSRTLQDANQSWTYLVRQESAGRATIEETMMTSLAASVDVARHKLGERARESRRRSWGVGIACAMKTPEDSQ